MHRSGRVGQSVDLVQPGQSRMRRSGRVCQGVGLAQPGQHIYLLELKNIKKIFVLGPILNDASVSRWTLLDFRELLSASFCKLFELFTTAAANSGDCRIGVRGDCRISVRGDCRIVLLGDCCVLALGDCRILRGDTRIATLDWRQKKLCQRCVGRILLMPTLR